MNRRPRPEAYRFDARYGRLIRKTGIGTVPFALFHYQGELQLQPQEVWFIAYILAHRWTSELPFPSLAGMAAHSGLTKRALRNYKDSLVAKGLLTIVARSRADGGTASHGYDFSPLFDALDGLITRDLEQWTRRSPQMLDDLDDLEDADGPEERLYPPPGEQVFPGAGARLLTGRRKALSPAPGNRLSPQKEDAPRADPAAQIPANRSPSQKQRNIDASMRPTDQDRIQVRKRRRPETAASQFPLPWPDASERRAASPPHAPLDDFVDEVSALLHDQPDSFHGNRVRVARLWEQSGLDEQAFRLAMHEAMRRTQGASARIRRQATGPAAFPGARNKVPYFLAVLENLLRDSDGAEQDDRQASGPGTPAARGGGRGDRTPERAPGRDAAAQLWEAVGHALRRQLRGVDWDTWLLDAVPVSVSGSELAVELPTEIAADWVSRKWGDLADSALSEAGGRPMRVRFAAAARGSEGLNA